MKCTGMSHCRLMPDPPNVQGLGLQGHIGYARMWTRINWKAVFGQRPVMLRACGRALCVQLPHIGWTGVAAGPAGGFWASRGLEEEAIGAWVHTLIPSCIPIPRASISGGFLGCKCTVSCCPLTCKVGVSALPLNVPLSGPVT